MSDKICVLNKDYLEIWKYFDKIDETKYFHLYKLKSLLWNTFDLLDRILKIEKEADNAE